VAAQIATAAAANSATLHGINWVASMAFSKADVWAFERMPKLGMNPRAGVELETKLAHAGATHNAFLLDADRQKQLDTLVASLRPVPAPPTAAELAAAPAPGVEVGDAVEASITTMPLGGNMERPATALVPTVPAPSTAN
jgi:hypothetical protein